MYLHTNSRPRQYGGVCYMAAEFLKEGTRFVRFAVPVGFGEFPKVYSVIFA